MGIAGHRRIATSLFVKHRPAGRPWTPIEALAQLNFDARDGLRPIREYARLFERGRDWVRRRLAEYRAALGDVEIAATPRTSTSRSASPAPAPDVERTAKPQGFPSEKLLASASRRFPEMDVRLAVTEFLAYADKTAQRHPGWAGWRGALVQSLCRAEDRGFYRRRGPVSVRPRGRQEGATVGEVLAEIVGNLAPVS